MKTGMITDRAGNRRWYLNGKLHRDNGPAVEGADGTRWWYLDGKRHRADGPAIEWADGTCAWYLDGVEYTFHDWLNKNTTLDERTRIILLLQYSDGVTS